MIRQWHLPILLLLLLGGCTPHFAPSALRTEEATLSALIARTIPSADRQETMILSREAIRYSRTLATQYRVSTPPLVHNFLVNVGVKERGLCYQWSDDLYRHLQRFRFKTLQLKPVGANIGKYWTEHNALALLPRGSTDLREGVLLDPWRKSGHLYFMPIPNDTAYHWRIRTDRAKIYQSGR